AADGRADPGPPRVQPPRARQGGAEPHRPGAAAPRGDRRDEARREAGHRRGRIGGGRRQSRPSVADLRQPDLERAEVRRDGRLAARARDGGAGPGGTMRAWVEDNGIGIAPEYHEKIFQVFERLNDASSYPGTGIGLAIVRRAAGRMGGKVGVVSEEGKGSRFWVELPRAGSVVPSATPAEAKGT